VERDHIDMGFLGVECALAAIVPAGDRGDGGDGG
jgi:hypothetical protein